MRMTPVISPIVAPAANAATSGAIRLPAFAAATRRTSTSAAGAPAQRRVVPLGHAVDVHANLPEPPVPDLPGVPLHRVLEQRPEPAAVAQGGGVALRLDARHQLADAALDLVGERLPRGGAAPRGGPL